MDNLYDHPLFPEPIPKYARFTGAIHPTTGVQYTFDGWNMHFRTNRRKQHLEVREKYEGHPWMNRQEAAKLAKIDMFGKREKLDKCGEDYAPRESSAQKAAVTVITVVQDWLHKLWDGDKIPRRCLCCETF